MSVLRHSTFEVGLAKRLIKWQKQVQTGSNFVEVCLKIGKLILSQQILLSPSQKFLNMIFVNAFIQVTQGVIDETY